MVFHHWGRSRIALDNDEMLQSQSVCVCVQVHERDCTRACDCTHAPAVPSEPKSRALWSEPTTTDDSSTKERVSPSGPPGQRREGGLAVSRGGVHSIWGPAAALPPGRGQSGPCHTSGGGAGGCLSHALPRQCTPRCAVHSCATVPLEPRVVGRGEAVGRSIKFGRR